MSKVHNAQSVQIIVDLKEATNSKSLDEDAPRQCGPSMGGNLVQCNFIKSKMINFHIFNT